MRPIDRDRLISRGLATIEELHPATLEFTGFAPVKGSRRNNLETRTLRAGGFTESAPVVFLLLKTRIPAGLEIEEQVTRFVCDGVTYRVTGADSEKHEPHVRLTTDLADR